MLPKYFRSSFKGFTLIELLVAISILSVVAAIGLTTFTQAQKVARDSKRKQDLRSIAVALEVYYQKYKHYPCATWWINSTGGGYWITNTSNIPSDSAYCGNSSSANSDPFNSTFISTMPVDPVNSGGYSYVYWSRGDGYPAGPPGCGTITGQSYYMYTKLENTADPDAHSKKQYKFCDTVFGTAYNDFFFVTSE
jgi:prepilin-type N-terminal cleavage/methylation domain-containing protein